MILTMKKKYSLTLNKEFIQYCELNDIDKIEKLAHDVFERGFTILKFGETPSFARGNDIIKEVEKIVEVEDTKKIEELSQKVTKLETELNKKPKTVTVEVIVEKIVEVIKEVPTKSDTEYITKEVIKEVIIEKPIYITDDQEIEKLKVENERLTKDLDKITTSLSGFNRAKYMKSSDLGSLYDE